MNIIDLAAEPRFAMAKSQLRQEIFVLSELDFKINGFFVEFGATNGVTNSNTWLLEKEFGWQGILAEPSKYWHKDLFQVRSAAIETRCVWTHSDDIVLFNEVSTERGSHGPELSTIDNYSDCDKHSNTREAGEKYQVETISLTDLLSKYDAPREIDYLSIDTEGSEFDILSNFEFDRYDIKIITCEHNYTPMRKKIYDLLMSKGYQRKHQDISQWDDWYVRS